MYPIISHAPNLLRKNVGAVIFPAHCSQGQCLRKPQFLPGVTPTKSPPAGGWLGPDSAYFHPLGASPADLGLDSGLREETCLTSPFGKYNFCSFLSFFLKRNSLPGGRTRKNGFWAKSYPWDTVKIGPNEVPGIDSNLGSPFICRGTLFLSAPHLPEGK